MKCLIGIDLVQAEWVVTAYSAQEYRMIEVVESRADPHLRTGHLISGAPEDFIKLEAKVVGHNTDPVEIARLRNKLPQEWQGQRISDFFLPRTMSIRQAGKKSNHGLNYNLQYRKFALVNGMEENEAKRICSLYRDVAYPGLKTWYKMIESTLRSNNRRLTNCFGQTRQFLDKWGPDLLDAAYAFYPQSTVANVTNFGLRGIYHDRRLRAVRPAVQEHDSVVNEHTFDSWQELAEQILICDRHMSTPCVYHRRVFTLRREIKLGLGWGENDMVTVDHEDIKGLPSALKQAWEQSSASRSA